MALDAGTKQVKDDLADRITAIEAALPATTEAPTATNDVLMGAQVVGVWKWVRQTIAQLRTAITAASITFPDSIKSIFGTGGDMEVYSSGDDGYIDNVTQDKDIIFKVNDGGVATEVLRIDGSTSRVGIDVAAPAEKLDVLGNIQSSGRFISSLAGGGLSPLSITSTVLNTNLNSDLLDSQQGSYYQNAGNLNAGTVLAARLNSAVQAYYTLDPLMPVANEVHNTLANSTIGELAIPSYMSNKLQFVIPTSVEYTTDGINWLDASGTYTAAMLRDLMKGRFSGSHLDIPVQATGWTGIRLTYTCTTYVYLHWLYLYTETQGHNLNVKVEKTYGSDVADWREVCTTANWSSWPGHQSIPHTNIPYNPTPTPGTHSKYIRLTFTPTYSGSYPSNTIRIFMINWYGLHPANNQQLGLFWDRDQNYFLPNHLLPYYTGAENLGSAGNMWYSIYMNGMLINRLATGTKPIDVTSTTVCTNLNADMVDGKHDTDIILKSVLTEQGDIIYASAASTPAALAHGNQGDILLSGGHGNNPTWLTMQKCRCYRNAALNTASSAWTKLPIDTDSFDSSNISNLANNRIIPTIAGYYQVNASLCISSSDGIVLAIGIYVNGLIYAEGHAQMPDDTGNIAGCVSDLVYCNGITDYIEVWYYVGGVKAFVVATHHNYLSVVGPF
jgi:hypothetical protein